MYSFTSSAVGDAMFSDDDFELKIPMMLYTTLIILSVISNYRLKSINDTVINIGVQTAEINLRLLRVTTNFLKAMF